MHISQGWKGAPLTLLALSLAAQESTAPAPAVVVGGKLPSVTVVVSATRTPRALKDTAASVSQSSAEELEERVAGGLQDLVRYEPGVSVPSKVDRQGATSFNIRGIDENRILILVDGVRVPDGPSAGRSFSRDLVDLDSVKRVEILRGPGSSLYGSDALGGVVTYVTKDPSDYLGASGKDLFASFASSYRSASGGTSQSLTAAGRRGDFDAILLFTHRNAHEIQPSTGVKANPQDTASDSATAKLVYRPEGAHTFRLSAGGLRRTTETELLSGVGTVAPGTSVLEQSGADRAQRGQFAFEHAFEDETAALFRKVTWRAFFQDAKTREETVETRTRSGNRYLREGEQRFLQTVAGAQVQGERSFAWGTALHRFIAGLEFDLTRTSRPRHKVETNLTTGASTTTVGGEAFPSKVFPDTTTRRAGFYLQDEVDLASGRLSLIPGLRYDRYRMDPSPDADFARSNPQGSAVRGLREGAFSPKFGIVGRFTETFSGTLQYARGFRIPPYDNANISFTNFAQRYTVLPNPDLKSERSDGFEAGLRGEGEGGSLAFTLFHNRYSDFIDFQSLGVNPTSGLLEFQSRNLSRVRIRGAEFRATLNLAGGFTFLSSGAYAQGDDLSTGQPLDSVDPLKGVAGLRYRAPQDRWGAEAVLTGVARKTRQPQPDPTRPRFESPGYATLDLLAHYRPSRPWAVNVGLFNVLNRTTWNWGDVRGLQASDPLVARAAQPGFHGGINVNYRW